MVPKHFYFGHVALALILVFAFQSFAASVQKRQALIPFPRTGKRANLPTIHKMEDSSPVEEIPEYLIEAANDVLNADRPYYPSRDNEVIQALLRELGR